MNKTLFSALGAATLLTACANDTPHDSGASDELSSQVAFYGLTVMDCQQQATDCVQSNSGGFLSGTARCSTKLTKCLANASAEVAKNVVEESKQVTQCASSGVECVSGAGKLRDVLSCQNTLESCVVERVNELTGIPLPTTQQVVAEVAEHAGVVVEHATEVVETVAETAHEVVDTAVDVADHAVDTAVTVADRAIETTGAVAEHVVEHATEVTGAVVETATSVVTDAVDTTLTVGKTALQCADESRTCIRTTKKLISCQLAYAECMAAVL